MTETPNPYIPDTDTMTGEMHPIRQAVLSLGSNLGERFTTIEGGVNALADTPDVTVVSVSPVYETLPDDAPEGSPKFLNVMLLVDTTLSVHTLLDRCLAVESAFGRERTGVRHEPRTLDVDLIVVGDRVVDDDDLTLPHPAAHRRAYILRPWLDVDPEAYIPGHGLVVELLDKLDESGIQRRDDSPIYL
ncbi:MAG TPA: 2-amino-4-hydroxy-6-hydroxymethyldihydropteridine diphosphokinase [Nocardioidaceae bacterium]|nr:2-amino-4-hydroxy-6-hydroxymethyldihydropteridine diphosphokinase [Nocardioidaceae bacterium]